MSLPDMVTGILYFHLRTVFLDTRLYSCILHPLFLVANLGRQWGTHSIMVFVLFLLFFNTLILRYPIVL